MTPADVVRAIREEETAERALLVLQLYMSAPRNNVVSLADYSPERFNSERERTFELLGDALSEPYLPSPNPVFKVGEE